MPPIKDKPLLQMKTLANKAGVIMLTVDKKSTVVDPLTSYNIFAQAESFRIAFETMYDANKEQHYNLMIVPALVNQIFALELYLKCLLNIEGKEIKKIHNIRELFDKLKFSVKERIKHYYDLGVQRNKDIARVREILAETGTVNMDFYFVLQEIQEVFQELRYDFEYKVTSNLGVKPIMGTVMYAVRSLILLKKSKWDTGYPPIPSYFIYKGLTKREAIEKSRKENLFANTTVNQDRYYIAYLCMNCGRWVTFKIDMSKIPGKIISVPEPDEEYPVEPYPITEIYACPKCSMKADVSNTSVIIEAHAGRKPDLSSEPSWLVKLIGY